LIKKGTHFNTSYIVNDIRDREADHLHPQKSTRPLASPLCCFGLFRYMLLIKRGASGDPTDSLLRDPLMFTVGLLWAIMVAASTYA